MNVYVRPPSPSAIYSLAHPLITHPQIHHVCEAGGGPCHRNIEAQNQMMRAMTGAPPVPPAPILPMPEGVRKLPLSRSCVNCHREPSEKRVIKRCARCKLTRYVFHRLKIYESLSSRGCNGRYCGYVIGYCVSYFWLLLTPFLKVSNVKRQITHATKQ